MLNVPFLAFFAFSNAFRSSFSSTVFSSWKSYMSAGSKCDFAPSGAFQPIILLISTRFARGNEHFSFIFKSSECPHISLSVLKPSFAIYSRSSCAMNFMKFSTYSGFPVKRLRSSEFCVATPNGQVSRLHTRIIAQPIVISGAVAKPNSSAPKSAAIATSRPLISLPSVSITTRLLSPF